MRGKVYKSADFTPHFWITPAHAGKRSHSIKQINVCWDHPRTCGEKEFKASAIPVVCGSPPHMRGKAAVFSFGLFSLRITPAHAGKRNGEYYGNQIYWDHPRTCGEKFADRPSALSDQGSPPHMRGKEMNSNLVKRGHRITPAHAGKSFENVLEILQEKDHPRTCGEKLIFDGDKDYILRITPAHAGKSKKYAHNARFFHGSPPHMRGKAVPIRVAYCAYRDHPRTCGEKCQEGAEPDLLTGSPPHMRGKGIMLVEISLVMRITPAHAGKRNIVDIGKSVPEDHPRTCGEKLQVKSRLIQEQGSPPHMRGKVFAGIEHICRSRITPAHAGKSDIPIIIIQH